MKALKDKTNTVPPGGDYPYGDLRDNPGDNSGTPVNRDLMGDIHRTVEKIMHEAGITANGLDDNEVNGYQIYEAMKLAFRPYKSIVARVDLSSPNVTVNYTDFPNVTLSLSQTYPYFLLTPSEQIFTAGKTVCVGNVPVVPHEASVAGTSAGNVGIYTTDAPYVLVEIRIYN